MSVTTPLALTDSLPLTCSRTGTCCHGKRVRLNPYELSRLAAAKGIAAREFRDRFCEGGGIVLRFDGKPGWKGLPACSQYVPGSGCSVHGGRPLACRLYPLGRMRQGEDLYYMFQGDIFPCLEGCPDVKSLPQLTVGDYVEGQGTRMFEEVQDAYLELMQDLADGAFAFVLETELARTGLGAALSGWKAWGASDMEKSASRLGAEWLDLLMLPDLPASEDGGAFVMAHRELLSVKTEVLGDRASSLKHCHEASERLMGLALHLARSLGMDASALGARWALQAQKLGEAGEKR